VSGIDWTFSRMIKAAEPWSGAPLVRGVMPVDAGHGAVRSAALHVSGLSVFEAYVNGQPVSDEVLAPGWSSYEWRLRYRTYDVTGLLDASSESVVVGIALGNGWACGKLGGQRTRGFWSDEPTVIALLSVTYADGHVQHFGTDDRTWQAGPSQVTANDLYDGQAVDARIDVTGWNSDPAPRDGWGGTTFVPFDHARLVPTVAPVIRRQEEIAPVAHWTSPSGRTIVDFGQNLVGWVKIRVTGEAGQVVTLRHAEVLEHEELGTRPLRSAAATDTYTLSGGDDTFEPTFTFHGFRYVEVTGWPGEIPDRALTAFVVHSDMTRIGTFECSDDLVNQLHRNVVWGQRGNFLDVPTDCPQRDERLGWTGDIAAFAPTAVYLYDVKAFLEEWLANVEAEQVHHNGIVPYVIPDVIKLDKPRPGRPRESTCLWSDAGVWVPWAVYEAYGDLATLRASYPTMTAHLDHVETLLTDDFLWEGSFQFADWLDPNAPPDNPFQAVADMGVVATACLYRSAELTTRTARLLGDAAGEARYSAYANRLRTAFNEHYVDGDGRIKSDCPTVYALAICFGLLSADHQTRAGNRLADLAEANGYRVATGFAGTPFVLPALTSTGHVETAYRLLLERECPSWLYPVLMGATTVWERWDSMLPDGTINPGQMTSFNHYAFGAVADWLHTTVGGIAALEPGYARVLISPRPGGGLTWARTSLDSPYGTVSVEWHLADGGFTAEILLPEGVTGVFRAPDGRETDLTAGQVTMHVRSN
jgi:alpha-L-rhamnosidase